MSVAAPAQALPANRDNEKRPPAKCVWKLRSPRGKAPCNALRCRDNLFRRFRRVPRGQNRPDHPRRNTARRRQEPRPQLRESAAARLPWESSDSEAPPQRLPYRGCAATRPRLRGPAPPEPWAALPRRPPSRRFSKTAALPMPQIKFSWMDHLLDAHPFYAKARSSAGGISLLLFDFPFPSSKRHDAAADDFFGWYVPGIARSETASRFHELMATTANVKSSSSLSLKCLRVCSYTSSGTCVCETSVTASVHSNAARSRSL